MSAIDEMRRLLDERGVEHYDAHNATYWGTDGAGMFTYSIREGADGLLNAHIHDLTPEQAIAATLGIERETELIRAMEDVLRHSTDTVWAGEVETLVDRMVSLGVYGHDVYEGARPWEVDFAAWNTRWHELFGTPERAARTMVNSCKDNYDYGCDGCPIARANCKCGDYDTILGWLRGDA